jgi:DNA processing protein
MTNPNELTVITQQDKRFPKLLKEIHDCPERIFIRGKLPPNDALCLSVVGTRKITSYGFRMVEQIIPKLVNHGIVIVSGLAFGVDAAVHRSTLNAGGLTIAVLPGGIDTRSIAPRSHVSLANSIVNSGCLLSEHAPETKTYASSFPVRNRLIAGMSKATLMIEGTERSGTMITASLALRENRDVLCIPGNVDSPQSAGALSLIRQGATLVRNSDDILEALGVSIKVTDKLAIPDHLKLIMDLIQIKPTNIDDIASKLSLPAATIMQNVCELELGGHISSQDRYHYSMI